MDNLAPLPLPDGVSSRQIDTRSRGLSFHILEAGHEHNQDRRRPLILLHHGFPEIAFSWRKVMPLLASAGCYVVAPDQRGYGRTKGWDNRDFDTVDLSDFSLSNLIRDNVMLIHALGYEKVKCIVGHDFGASSASLCALARPDIFQSLVMMSHTFNTPPKFAVHVNDNSTAASQPQKGTFHADLAALGRKHYKWYYSTQPANADMSHPPQGLHEFLRGYFYLKSASWAGNSPHTLQSWTASELAKMPHYYVMPLHGSMPEAVAAGMQKESPSDVQASHSWFPDSALSVYAAEYARTGFQGGLNWYRIYTHPDPKFKRDLDMFAGKKIECPCAYISGRQDWGTYQAPGGLEKLSSAEVCEDFRGVTLIDGAGHWVPQEKPKEVVNAILAFLDSLDGGKVIAE